MRFSAFYLPNQKRRKPRMTRRSESLQRNLFEEDEPRVELAAAQKIDLAVLLEVLLREIAIALASGESGHDQDHD
jgi:hypothetical protein